MNDILIEALDALILGMGTVFVGLLLLMAAMKAMVVTVGALQQREKARAEAKERAAQAARRSGGGTDLEMSDDEGEFASGELVAAAALALHLDALVFEELEAQRLTWTRMFKPFSPWLMDAKNSLHTHRIRYRAHGSTGSIVRERGPRG